MGVGRAPSVHLISPSVTKDIGPSPYRGQLCPLTSLAEASLKGYQSRARYSRTWISRDKRKKTASVGTYPLYICTTYPGSLASMDWFWLHLYPWQGRWLWLLGSWSFGRQILCRSHDGCFHGWSCCLKSGFLLQFHSGFLLAMHRWLMSVLMDEWWLYSSLTNTVLWFGRQLRQYVGGL